MQDTGFQQGLANTNRAMRTLQSEFRAISQGMGGFSNAMDQTRARADTLGRMIDTQRQKIDQLRAAYERTRASQGEDAAATQRWAGQLNRAVGDLNRFEQELRQVNSQLEQQSNRMLTFGNRMQGIGDSLQNAGMQLGLVFGGAAMAIGAGLKSAIIESMNFEQQMANIKAVSGATGAEMSKISELAVDMGAKTKYSSVEAGKGIEELIKAGVSLKDILNGGLEGALNLATAGELELGEAAEIASTALNSFKADHLSVADAANILAGAANASATDVHELKYGLAASAAVAAGAGMSFKDTSTALAVLAQNGLKGSDAGTSLKTMLMRLNPSTKEAYNKMRDLGLITYNAQAGFDFLVQNGITPASRSVGDIETSLEQYVMKTEGVTKWNDKCDTTFRELATSSAFLSSKFYDQQGHIQSLENISGTLHESMKGLTDQQRSMALETLFGSDAVRGATILFKEGANGVRDMWSEMSKVTAADVAATKMNTLKGRIEQLSGSFDTMKKTIGDALAPIAGVFVVALQALVDGFNALPGPIQKALAIFGGIAFALTSIAAVFGIFLAAIGGIVSGIGALGIAIAELGGIAAIGSAMMGALGTALSFITGPIGITVAAIAGLALGFKLLYDNSEGVRNAIAKIGEAFQGIKTIFGGNEGKGVSILAGLGFTPETIRMILAITNGIKTAFNEIKQQVMNLGQFFQGIGALFGGNEGQGVSILSSIGLSPQTILSAMTIINGVKDAITQGMTGIMQTLQTIGASIGQFWVMHGTQIMTFASNAWNSIKNIVSTVLSGLFSITSSILTGIADFWNQNGSQIMNFVSIAWNGIMNIIGTILGAIFSIIGSTLASIAEFWNAHGSQIMAIVSGAFSVVSSIISGALGFISGLFQSVMPIVSGVTQVAFAVVQAVITTVGSVISGVVAMVGQLFRGDWKGAFETARSTASDIMNNIVSIFKGINLLQIGKDIINGLINGISSMASSVIDTAKKIASTVTNTIKGALDIHSPSRVMLQIGKWTTEGMAIGMNENVKNIISASDNIAQAAIPSTTGNINGYGIPFTQNDASKNNENGVIVQVIVDQPIIVDGRTVQRVVRKENYREDKINFLKRGQI
ncbi:phage tail tape measure protein [Bacillus cereus group sp. BfR-BA-01380]|uniref:phage tail tape measure protein n=1 Tax=Bacillus cereus group sp. BfR-BA-01380 TaxID=2920324 RepID=UPI0037BE339F